MPTRREQRADAIGWAVFAVQTRDCLRHLGFDIPERCMPDEPKPCGASFQQHARANLSALLAVVDHHLDHAGGVSAELYTWAVGKIAQECPRE